MVDGGGCELPIGAWCTVQIRRDALGLASGPLVAPVPERNDTGVTGRLAAACDRWIVLDVAGGTGEPCELWVPMDVVLVVEVRRGGG